MDYGDIISRSWRITWNNKFLWVLGFLAALGSVGGNFNNGSNVSQQYNGDNFNPDALVGIGAIVAVLACVGAIIGLILWLVSLVAKGGLISAVSRIEDGEKVTLSDAFAAGTGKIWSLMGMTLLLYLPFIVLSIAVVVVAGVGLAGTIGGAAYTGAFDNIANDPTGAIAAFGWFFACLGLLFCILFPLGIFLQFVYAFALRGLVLRDLGAVDSIRHGWQVLRANASEVILLSVLFFVIGLIYGFLTGLVLLPLTVVTIFPILGTAMSGGEFGGGEIALLIGGGLCIGIIGAVLNSVLVTWQSATFTLAYRQFTSKKLGMAEG